MKIYKKNNDERIEINNLMNLFERINTHSGDTDRVTIILTKEDQEKGITIKDLMLRFSIIENEETYNLLQNDTTSSEVYYYRMSTGKNMTFSLSYQDQIIKPSKEGFFFVEKDWKVDELEFVLTINVEKGFSESFGENKNLLFSIEFFGAVEEKQNEENNVEEFI